MHRGRAYLAAVLIETGRIRCEVDIFVPMRERCQGPVIWNEKMILKSDYVIIPWMSEITEPKQGKILASIINVSSMRQMANSRPFKS